MSDDYLLLTVTVGREQAELLEDALLQFGALSCTFVDAEDQPIHEPAPGSTPLWSQVQVTGMFAAESEPELLCKLLQDQIGGIDRHQILCKTLEGRQWERAWMDDYEPIKITEQLWVVPSFCDVPDPLATNIIIDPGLAFGSGTHATTYLCLHWLGRQSLQGKTVIDYGCGSGILAVAAARLGAACVYAYDIDSQALQATTENAKRNGVENKIEVCKRERDLPMGASYLVANILLSPLLDLAPRFNELLEKDGKLGLSGVLAEQVAELAGVYSRLFQHQKTEIRDQWSLYSAKRKGDLHC